MLARRMKNTYNLFFIVSYSIFSSHLFFLRQIMNPTTAATSVTGSANMNTDIFPVVSVTIVEHRRIRLIHELRTTRPVLSLCAFLAISKKSKQTAALAAGYKGSMPRAIVPPALP